MKKCQGGERKISRLIRVLIFLEIIPLKLCPHQWGWVLKKLGRI